MTVTSEQAHLRKYIEDGIDQKIRLSHLLESYKKQEEKTRERIIDQSSLINKLTAENAPESKINLFKERLNRDQAIVFKLVQNTTSEILTEIDWLILKMAVSLEELSEIEIDIGGFVTHAIGVDTNAKLDKDNMVVTFKKDGHIEIPIGTKMSKWKDSSQLTINKTIKAGS
ncbi:hypothetical protein KC480_05205 [Bacillus velezensis]|uniref:hypothetical protein n=1 Tax=Bacillus velezensis TaxID=492670 RepID=UPI001E3687BD|nr:hypothetical protein [Bacillus velezensis]MCD7910922.1 hypothetical protein [Bacillus velezensis]